MKLLKEFLHKCEIKQLKALKKKFTNQLLQHNTFVMGTMQRRYHFCRKIGCKCMDKKNPQPHGPYNYLAYRGSAKPGMLVLDLKQYKQAHQMIKNYHTLWELFCSISSINIELLRRR